MVALEVAHIHNGVGHLVNVLLRGQRLDLSHLLRGGIFELVGQRRRRRVRPDCVESPWSTNLPRSQPPENRPPKTAPDREVRAWAVICRHGYGGSPSLRCRPALPLIGTTGWSPRWPGRSRDRSGARTIGRAVDRRDRRFGGRLGGCIGGLIGGIIGWPSDGLWKKQSGRWVRNQAAGRGRQSPRSRRRGGAA